jgi:alkylation response protein AidB-like acyl-CoA dehydrogenase
MSQTKKALPKFGEQIPFCEPAWYQGFPSPYYHEGHAAFRAKVREFVEKEVAPFVDDWIKNGGYPLDLHVKAYAAGIGGILYPKEWGGTKPDDFDYFYEQIMWDEFSRAGGGQVYGQADIDSMALPPILKFGSDYLKEKVCRGVVTGRKHIALAISEPYAGSDVAGIRTTAVRDGDFYIVNGTKKWITGGLFADFFTVAVRTGGQGMGGVSLLLLEKGMPGIHVRKMETQFDTCHNTTFITLEDVRVPAVNIIGAENMGFMIIMTNFNHERFLIATRSTRGCRMLYEASIKYAMERETFGKKLITHQIIRYKLAEMVRMIEALQDFLDKVTYLLSAGVPEIKLGGHCALLKVQASKTLEYCAREASQIFGGNSIVKEGKGKLVERAYRDVRSSAIPGGSEEILLDFSMRQVAAQATKLAKEKQSKL